MLYVVKNKVFYVVKTSLSHVRMFNLTTQKMSRNLKLAMKCNGYTFYPVFLKNTPSTDRQGGYRGINIRITKDQKFISEIECYDKKGIRIKATEFKNGNITKGYNNDIIEEFNNRIKELLVLVCKYLTQHEFITKTLLMEKIYGREFISKVKKKRTKYVTIPVTDDEGKITGELQLTNEQVNEALACLDDDIYSEDEIFEKIEIAHASKFIKEQEAKMTLEERYKNNRYNKKNIFEVIGSLLYLTQRAGKIEKTLLAPKFHRILKRLILFRENNTSVSTHIKDFNADWVYKFFDWISERNTGRHFINLPKPNPFVFNEGYVLDDSIKYEPFSFDSFKDNIFKEMTMVINALYKQKLIHEHFKVSFEGYGETAYGKKIYSLTPSEFLTLIKAKNLTKDEEKVRDAFAVMVWQGNRPSDYKTDKAISNIDNTIHVEFISPKTGLSVNTFLTEPVKRIYKKWKGLPVVSDDEMNTTLRSIAKKIGLNRIIEKSVSKVGQQRTIERIALHDLISQKFGRGTFYLIGAIVGRSFESLMNSAGHTDKSIVNRHYWNVGYEANESIKKELIKIYKGKK